MGIEITAVRRSPSNDLDGTITRVAWRNDTTGATGTATLATVVTFISKNEMTVYVGAGRARDRVVVVRPRRGKPFVRTRAGSQWTDALLTLPTF